MKNEKKAIKAFLMMQLSILNQWAYRYDATREELHKELDEALNATDRLLLTGLGNPTLKDFMQKILGR